MEMRDDGRDFCVQLSLPAFCSVLSHSSCKVVISKLKDYCVSNLQGFLSPMTLRPISPFTNRDPCSHHTTVLSELPTVRTARTTVSVS